MSFTPDPWTRLVTAARRAPQEDLPAAMPLGFATRVVAQTFATRSNPWRSLIEQVSWRALGVSAGLAVASAAFNFAPAVRAFQHDPVMEQDPVVLALEMS